MRSAFIGDSGIDDLPVVLLNATKQVQHPPLKVRFQDLDSPVVKLVRADSVRAARNLPK